MAAKPKPCRPKWRRFSKAPTPSNLKCGSKSPNRRRLEQVFTPVRSEPSHGTRCGNANEPLTFLGPTKVLLLLTPGDAHDLDGVAHHVGWALLASRSLGHRVSI